MEKNKWIDEVLKSTNGADRAEAGPFFFEKVSQRIASQKQPATETVFRRAWLLRVSLATLIVVNALFIVPNFRTTNNPTAVTKEKDIYAELSRELGYESTLNY